MTRFARFALPDLNGANVGVEIGDSEARQLAIASTCLQRGLHQLTEIRLARVYQPLGFSDCQISQSRRVDILERFDLPPCDIGSGISILEGVIECRPQKGPYAVGR